MLEAVKNFKQEIEEFPESRSYESQSRDTECAPPALGELAGTARHTFWGKQEVLTVVMDSGMHKISYRITGCSVAKES